MVVATIIETDVVNGAELSNPNSKTAITQLAPAAEYRESRWRRSAPFRRVKASASMVSTVNQKKGRPISIATVAAAVGANCPIAGSSMSRKMGKSLEKVPAPVPAQPLSVNIRWVASIKGVGVLFAKARDKSSDGLLSWVPKIAVMIKSAIDMIAAIPQDPMSNRRIAVATIKVATPQATAKYILLVPIAIVLAQQSAKATEHAAKISLPGFDLVCFERDIR